MLRPRPLARGILLALLVAAAAEACEPCRIDLGLDASIARADLVVVGERTGPPDPGPVRLEGPDTITVRVAEVLKGSSETARELTVNAWDGMCPYGIVIAPAQRFVILLARERAAYDAVENGCAVKTLALREDGRTGEPVVLLGEREMALAELRERILQGRSLERID